jgi:hypothetical protein
MINCKEEKQYALKCNSHSSNVISLAVLYHSIRNFPAVAIPVTTPFCYFPFMPLFHFVNVKVFKCVVYVIPLVTQRPVSAGTTSELGFGLCIPKLYFDLGGC